MNEEQGKLFDEVKAEGGPLGGPYWAYIRYPKLMRMAQDMSKCLSQGGLSKRERQIAIIAIIRFWGAEYPLAVQARNALNMGFGQDIIDAINAGGTPALTDPREKMAYGVAMELLKNHKLSDATYAEAGKLFNEKELVSLVAIVGQFTMTCLTAIAYDCTPAGDAQQRLRH
jgi:4-carboxymuconolactone decarboxylase